jgi:hypothetical protein
MDDVALSKKVLNRTEVIPRSADEESTMKLVFAVLIRVSEVAEYRSGSLSASSSSC